MNHSFSSIIKQVNLIDSSQLRDEIKLRRSGELIYKVSEQILRLAKTLLEKSQQPQVDEADTQIDRSFSEFLSSLTQQSISTLFLAKYLQPQLRERHKKDDPMVKLVYP